MGVVRVLLLTLLLASLLTGQDAGRLQGRLVGQDGGPVAGRIELRSANRMVADLDVAGGEFELAVANLPLAPTPELVLPGPITYQLYADTVRALAAGETVALGDIFVGETVKVTGRVVAADGTLQLGKVEAKGTAHSSRALGLGGEWSAWVDPETGEFLLDGLPPGPLLLLHLADFDVPIASAFRAPVFEGATAQIDLEPGGEHYQVLTLGELPVVSLELDPAPLPAELFHSRGQLVGPFGTRLLGHGQVGTTITATAFLEPLLQLRFDTDEIEAVAGFFTADDGPVVVPVRPSSGVDLTVPDAASFRVSARHRIDDRWSAPIEFGWFQASAQLRLTPGFWLLEVDAPGFPLQQRALLVSRAVVAPLELRPRHATTLTVQADGGPNEVPVAGLSIHVEYGPAGLSIASSSLRTDETGHAQLTDFVPGPARVGVAFGPSLMRWADLEDGATEVTITAPPAGWVDLHLEAPEHVDLRSVLARAERDPDSRLAGPGVFTAERAFDAAGRVRLGPLLAGRRQVQLMRPGLAWEDWASIDVSPGEVALIERDERETYPAAVTVVLEPSLAQAGRFNVDLRGADGLRLQRVSSLFGRVTFAGVPPGTYTVWCEPVHCTWAYHDPTKVVVGPGQQMEHTVPVPLVEREVALQGPDGEAWSLRPFLYSVAEGHVHLRRTDKDGHWSVALPPGSLRVWPVTRDREDATVLAWGAGDEPLIITLEP